MFEAGWIPQEVDSQSSEKGMFIKEGPEDQALRRLVKTTG